VSLNVLREKQVVNISSKDIVPGDIVFLKEPIKMPFDGIVF
jgi:magnesium-transporting ATPase (P-type)